MSFSLRLTLFFVLIVVLPIIALAVLVAEVSDEADLGKIDAALAAGLRTALAIRDETTAESNAAMRRIARDPRLARAVESGRDAVQAVAPQLARAGGAAALRIAAGDGRRLAAVGGRPLVAEASGDLVRGNRVIATVTATTTTPERFLAEIEEKVGESAALATGDRVIAATGRSAPESIPSIPAGGSARTSELDGEQVRVAAAQLGDGLRIALSSPLQSDGFFASRPRVALGLVGFLVVALIAALTLTRALRGQVRAMLAAARRIGSGEFSADVPVVGNDELAQLAREFNKMSERLGAQMDELRRQRVEIGRSVQRIGDAVASGLDREALLGILVETAVTACEAEYGAVTASGRAGAEAEYGSPTARLREVALAAEREALRERGLAVCERGALRALSSSLEALGGGETVGVMTIARRGRAFSEAERDVFTYLLGQAAASVENVALHELVAEQAVTDDLTGLPNKRAFREALAREAARAQRFGHPLALLIIDLDDFKQINDTRGHVQGDAVLRAIGEVIASESREIDQPGRYGGEEFVVALPETGLEGAREVAERIRRRIAARPVAGADGAAPVHVTASIGVAALAGDDVGPLIAAADEALYAAKREGKNRVVAASPSRRAKGPGDEARI